MANPQTGNGYTILANEILENLAKTRIPGEARQILDLIIRKTYGFKKKEDAISLTQFVEGTRLKRPSACRAINKLIEMNIAIKKPGDITKYSLNKDFDTWEPVAKRSSSEKVNEPVALLPTASSEKVNKVVTKTLHTKERKESKQNKLLQKATGVADPINELINLFETVNPTHYKLFANKTQRSALDRLIKKFGEQKVREIILSLEYSNAQKFAPTITTPYELERDLGRLIAFYKKEQTNNPQGKHIVL